MENPFENIVKEINSIKALILDNMKANRQPEQAQPEIMSIKETAEFLRLSESKIYQLVSRNEITHFKQGSRVLFSRNDLLQWLQQFKQTDNRTALKSCDDFIQSKKR